MESFFTVESCRCYEVVSGFTLVFEFEKYVSNLVVYRGISGIFLNYEIEDLQSTFVLAFLNKIMSFLLQRIDIFSHSL